MNIPDSKIREYTRRIMLARMKLLCGNGFYGLLLMHVKMGLGTEHETAWTEDGSKIMFNPGFIENLSDNELEYALMHEILHIALKHLERSGHSNGSGLNYERMKGSESSYESSNTSDTNYEDLYGLAADIVVNSNILRANGGNESSIYLKDYGGVQPYMLPNGDDGWKYSVEEVFSLLGGDGKGNYNNNRSENTDKKDESETGKDETDEDEIKEDKTAEDQTKEDETVEDQIKEDETGEEKNVEKETCKDKTEENDGKNLEDDKDQEETVEKNMSGSGNSESEDKPGKGGSGSEDMLGKSGSGHGDKPGKGGSGSGDKPGKGGSGSGNNCRNTSGWDTHTFSETDEKNRNIQDEQWKAYICQAAEAMAKQFRNLETDPEKDGNLRGLIPGFAQRLLEELKDPQVDWRTVLQEFVQEEITDYSFMPPDRRFGDSPFFLPDYNEKDEKIEKILFMIDTSGSMSRKTITAVYSEIKGAIDQYSGRLQGWLGFFDAAVVEPVPFENEEELLDIKPAGGGGTRFDIIFSYVEEYMSEDPPVSIVILTDGIAPFPDERMTNGIPVLWVLTSDITPPWGKIAKVKAD